MRKLYNFNICLYERNPLMKKKLLPLFLIILFQTILIVIIFTSFKQGFHSDEVFNYAISNSANNTEMTKLNNGDSLMNQWLDSDYFLRYISASKEHRFDYSIPFRNAANDLNPPFQYMILHTICSFFPETFSWYYCFVINIVAFITSQIYLYRVVRGMTKNYWAGLAAVILYGFGTGAMSATIYIRIYAVAVAFSIMFAFYSYKIYDLRKEKKIAVRYFVGLFVSCLLGTLTLHLFLTIAFLITLCYSLFFLFSKRIKLFWIHGLTCLAAALLSIAIVPNTFKHVGGINQEHSFSSVSYPFLTDLRLYLYTITKDLFGIHVLSYDNVYFVSALVILGVITIFLIPIVFLVKNEKWFKTFIEWLKERGRQIKEKSKNFCYPLIPLFVCIAGNLAVVVKWTSYYYMGKYSGRYVFCLYPLTVALAVCFAYFVFQLIIGREKISIGLILSLSIVLAGWTHFTPDCWAFLFRHEESGISFKEIDKQQDAREIIVIWDNETWTLACLAPELYHTDSYYATDYSNYRNEEIFADVDTDKPYYILVDQHYILPDQEAYEDLKNNLYYMAADELGLLFTEEDFLSFYNSIDCIESVEHVGDDLAFERDYKIYSIHFKK